MRIGIDMRMARTGEGIARYIGELVRHLEIIDPTNEYFLFYHKKDSPLHMDFIPTIGQRPNFKVVFVSSDYYSWAEQTKFIWELKKYKPDLVHFASFNYPILYPGKFIVTIHDIIHHLYPGKKRMRLAHRLAYRLVFSSAVKRARKVIAVSKNTRQDILETFRTHPEKIEVITEGVNKRFQESASPDAIERTRRRYRITKPYLLFVGVWRQYKNLPRLARAFDILREKYQQDCQLVLAGKIDPFYPEIKKAIYSIKHRNEVRGLGFIPDEDLPSFYQGAAAFVLPSLIEGFGLIGVEAQTSRIPVLASDVPVLREVLGDGAWYFDPYKPADMAEKINKVLSNEDLRESLLAKGLQNCQKYSWTKAAEKTLEIYQSI